MNTVYSNACRLWINTLDVKSYTQSSNAFLPFADALSNAYLAITNGAIIISPIIFKSLFVYTIKNFIQNINSAIYITVPVSPTDNLKSYALVFIVLYKRFSSPPMPGSNALTNIPFIQNIKNIK